DGSIHILAYAKEDSSTFIRKGVIYNLNKTAQSLTSIINQLENKLDATIAKVYVGIGGQSLRTVKNTVVRHLEEESMISQELIDAINDENVQIPLIDLDILDVVPQEYKVGNNLQIDPVGVLNNHIEGRFLNIIARNSVKRNLETCFKQANIEVADYFISPLVAANMVLSDSEKRSGCALIDFGADTTTVSVYKNNILRYLTVIPIGSNSITRDICDLQIEESEAEELKIKYGNAINEQEEEGEEKRTYTLDNKRTIGARILNDIVEARTEEIILNAWNQIQLSGYDDKLISGIILIGGGSNLCNIEEVIRKKTKINKIRIAKAVIPGVDITDSEMQKSDETKNTILGILYAGNENCKKIEEVKPIPHSQSFSLFDEEIEKKEKPEKSKAEKKEKDNKKDKGDKPENNKSKQSDEKKNGIGDWLKKATSTLFDDSELKD
ncbi:MAG: cell division protein FtsA, partial [Bacteroides sp.]